MRLKTRAWALSQAACPRYRAKFVPLLHFVIAVIRLLDMACRDASIVSNEIVWPPSPPGIEGVWRRQREINVPVFIITCVVARLTFFLKPVREIGQTMLFVATA